MFLTVRALRIVADHHRIAGRRGFADRKAADAFGGAVGPGRVEIAIGRPGGIPSVAVIAIVMPPGEIDSAELLGLLERAILRRPIGPDEALLRRGCGLFRRALCWSRALIVGVQIPLQTKKPANSNSKQRPMNVIASRIALRAEESRAIS